MTDEQKVWKYLIASETHKHNEDLRAYHIMGYMSDVHQGASIPDIAEGIADSIAELAENMGMILTVRHKSVRRSLNLLIKEYGMVFRDENDIFHLTDAGRMYVERYPV